MKNLNTCLEINSGKLSFFHLLLEESYWYYHLASDKLLIRIFYINIYFILNFETGQNTSTNRGVRFLVVFFLLSVRSFDHEGVMQALIHSDLKDFLKKIFYNVLLGFIKQALKETFKTLYHTTI